MASVKMNGQTVRQVLTAACAASAFLLVGCDNSSNTAAQEVSEKAAARALSAGEPRGTDKLMAEVNSDTLKRDLETRLTEYVQKNAPEVDLKAAIQELQGAISTEPAALIKIGLESQLGSTQMRLSDARFAALRADILALNEQGANILSLAQTVKGINNAIAVLEGTQEPPAADAAAAAALVKTRQGELESAKAKVADLEKTIGEMEAQAKKIYAETDTAFAATEQMKGKTAIDAAAKAMKDRAKAEDLMAEVSYRGPALAEAKAQVILAEVSLKEAQDTSTLTEAGVAANTAAAQSKAKRLEALHKAAAEIVDAKEDGLTVKVAALVAKFNDLEKKIKEAAEPAEQASGNFGKANSDYSTLTSDLLRKAEEKSVDQNDPIRKIYKDDRGVVLLSWSQAAAQQQAGNVYLSGVQAYDLLAKVSEVVGQAKVKMDAKYADAKAIASDANRQAYAKSAATNFDAAVKTADGANKHTGAELDKIRWMGLSLAATANQGAFLAGNAAALAAAKKAKDEAVAINPALEGTLGWVGQ